jgi:hypothetical protein
MTSMTAAVTAGLGLAAGTFAIRVAGPVLASRLHLSERVQTLVDASAIVILCSVMASSALMNGRHFSDPARPAGVAVAIVLTRYRVPFPLVILAAAGTTAALRYLGY